MELNKMFADERRMQTDISRMLKGQKMIENGVTPEELQRNIFNVRDHQLKDLYSGRIIL
jgi:hypothetical protein